LGDPCTTKIDALGTITGRVGVAFDRALLYGKGGVAWAHASHTSGYTTDADPAWNYSAEASETRWGWTVGAGVEFALSSQLSAKVEYNYIDLGSSDVAFHYPPPNATAPAAANSDMTINVIKAGLNYRFGSR
jgi:outer membrane immunogenic protein